MQRIAQANKKVIEAERTLDDRRERLQNFAYGFCRDVAVKTLEGFRKRAGITPMFFPIDKDVFNYITYEGTYGEKNEDDFYEYDYGPQTHFVVSMPVPTAVRARVDLENNSEYIPKVDDCHKIDYHRLGREEALLDALLKNGYGDSSMKLAEILRDPHAMAFSAGYDNTNSFLFDPGDKGKQQLAKSEKECPGYGTDFRRGVIAGKDKPESNDLMLSSSGPRRCTWFSICLVIDNVLNSDYTPAYAVKANFSEDPCPHSCPNEYWLFKTSVSPETTVSEITKQILDVWEPSPALHEEANTPSMSM